MLNLRQIAVVHDDLLDLFGVGVIPASAMFVEAQHFGKYPIQGNWEADREVKISLEYGKIWGTLMRTLRRRESI